MSVLDMSGGYHLEYCLNMGSSAVARVKVDTPSSSSCILFIGGRLKCYRIMTYCCWWLLKVIISKERLREVSCHFLKSPALWEYKAKYHELFQESPGRQRLGEGGDLQADQGSGSSMWANAQNSLKKEECKPMGKIFKIARGWHVMSGSSEQQKDSWVWFYSWHGFLKETLWHKIVF